MFIVNDVKCCVISVLLFAYLSAAYVFKDSPTILLALSLFLSLMEAPLTDRT